MKKRQAQDLHCMQQALAMAETGLAAGEVPVGAVVVYHDDIIARAYNRTRSDTDPTGHAELVALREASLSVNSARLDGATLYVTIEPCVMCAGALLQARIQRLVFGAREPRTGGVVSIADTLMNPSNTHHVAITEGVLAEPAAALMQRFFRHRRDD